MRQQSEINFEERISFLESVVMQLIEAVNYSKEEKILWISFLMREKRGVEYLDYIEEYEKLRCDQ